MRILILALILIIPTSVEARYRYKHHHVKKEIIPLPKERPYTFNDMWNERINNEK